MKTCPTCNRTFEDAFTFCLIDGAVLSAPYDPQATQRIPGRSKTEPPTTEVLPGKSSLPSTLPASASPPPLPDVVSQSTKPSREPEFKKPSWFKRMIRAMFKFGLIGILPGILVGVIIVLNASPGRPMHTDEQFAAIGGGALAGFVAGAILLLPFIKFIKYVRKD
jgi:hypothetical protein